MDLFLIIAHTFQKKLAIGLGKQLEIMFLTTRQNMLQIKKNLFLR
jgi:hypothetical protein